MNCAWSFDDNYAQHGGISMLSLFENNRDIDEINVWLLVNNVSDDNRRRLEQIGRDYGRRITFVEMQDAAKKMKTKTKFNLSSYGRLFLADIEGVDRMLYLDSDTVVCDSLAPLLDLDMTGTLWAGVQDAVNPYFTRAVGYGAADRYINAGGVGVFNLDLWRRLNVVERCLDYISLWDGHTPLDDQGTLNHVCYGRTKITHPRYNVINQFFLFPAKTSKRRSRVNTYYTQEEIDDAVARPAVVHYCVQVFNRPWFEDCTHPYRYRYEAYKAMSPWAEVTARPAWRPRIAAIEKWVYERLPKCMFTLMGHYIWAKHELTDRHPKGAREVRRLDSSCEHS